MIVDVAVAAVIERPIAEVSAFTGDPSNSPIWRRRISSAEWQTDPPTLLGSRIALRSRILGREVVRTYEIVDHAPGFQVAMRTVPGSGPLTIQTTSTWRALSGRATHMVLRFRGEAGGAWLPVAPLLSSVMRREMARDLARLERVLEARSTD
jgi:uncharacterized membrane protein